MGWLWALVLQGYAWSGPLMMLLYPLIASIMAIESPDMRDDRQWLTYWVLCSLALLLEIALAPVIVWIPFYSTIKLVIASWLVLPQFRGGTFLYENFVRPHFNDAAAAATNAQDPQQEWLERSVSPETQASVARFVEKHGSPGFDALMRAALVHPKLNSVDGMKERGLVDENAS